MNSYNLFQRSEIINKLKEMSNIFDQYNIEAWVKPEGAYEINIFTVLLDNNKQLEDCWESLTNNIAVHFQSELEKNIERWNIYVVFLIQGQVEKEVKYELEQDKYSSRKLVFDNFKIEGNVDISKEIQGLLDNKLFGFQLYQLKMDNRLTMDLPNIEDIIRNTDGKLYQIIKYAKSNSKVKPEKLLDLYLE